MNYFWGTSSSWAGRDELELHERHTKEDRRQKKTKENAL